MSKQAIVLKNITKTYKLGREKITALNNVNVVINAGELVAIVGPSGSGKTTFAHVLGGLIKPDSGSIEIEGEQMSVKNDRKMSAYRNQKIGFVFQNYSLLPHYTALENVSVPLMVAGMRPKERRKKATQYLKAVGLEGQIKQRANQLSGGQRQRVSIARALVAEPEIIIADEPTGNLDTKRGGEVMDMLEFLSKKQGITVVMVTHDDKLAQRADRRLHITDGKVTEV